MNDPNRPFSCSTRKCYNDSCTGKDYVQCITNISLDARMINYQLMTMVIPAGTHTSGTVLSAPSYTYTQYWELFTASAASGAVFLRAYADVNGELIFDANDDPGHYFLVTRTSNNRFRLIFPITNVLNVGVPQDLLDFNVVPPTTKYDMRILYIVV